MIVKKNKFVIAGGFFVLAFASSLFAFYLISKPEKEIKTITFSPKWVNQAQFAGIFVAKDLGFYEKRGLNVEINNFETGDSVADEIISGESQFGLMNANDFLLNYAEGKDIMSLAAFYKVSPYIVASLKNNSITSPIELKNKKLGIKGAVGVEAQLIFDLLLSSAGLDRKDVEFVNIPFETSEADDLLNNSADVVGFYRTRLYQFDKEGLSYDVLYPERYGAALYNDVLVGTNTFINENPEVVSDFIEATIDGWDYAFKNKDEAIAITLRYVEEGDYKDIDYEMYILEQAEKLMLLDGKISEMGNMKLEDWENFYETLYDIGFIDEKVDISKAFTNKYLP